MAGGWQEGKEEKLTEMEGCVYKNEVILGPGPGIVNEFVRLPETKIAGVKFFSIPPRQGAKSFDILRIRSPRCGLST